MRELDPRRRPGRAPTYSRGSLLLLVVLSAIPLLVLALLLGGDPRSSSPASPVGEEGSATGRARPAGEFVPFWVRTRRVTGLWSSPDRQAARLGQALAGSGLRVVRPAEGARYYVYNPATENYAYVDVAAVESLPEGADPSALRSAPAAPGQPTFADVPPEDPAYPAIEQAARRGLTTGCQTNPATGQRRFCPDEPLTRRDLAVLLLRALGLGPAPAETPTFADVPSSDRAYGWIEQLARRGLTTGCGADAAGRRFCPEEPVQRSALATFLLRALGEEPEASGGGTFEDLPATDPRARWAERAYRLGLMAACLEDPAGGTRRFCPDQTVSRREAVELLTQVFPAAGP